MQKQWRRNQGENEYTTDEIGLRVWYTPTIRPSFLTVNQCRVSHLQSLLQFSILFSKYSFPNASSTICTLIYWFTVMSQYFLIFLHMTSDIFPNPWLIALKITIIASQSVLHKYSSRNRQEARWPKNRERPLSTSPVCNETIFIKKESSPSLDAQWGRVYACECK